MSLFLLSRLKPNLRVVKLKQAKQHFKIYVLGPLKAGVKVVCLKIKTCECVLVVWMRFHWQLHHYLEGGVA